MHLSMGLFLFGGLRPSFWVVFALPFGWYSGGIRVVFAGIRLGGASWRFVRGYHWKAHFLQIMYVFLHEYATASSACIYKGLPRKWYSTSPVTLNIILIKKQIGKVHPYAA